MTVELIQTFWELGELYPEQFPGIATDLLQQGFESESLIELAGLVKPNREKVDKTFRKAILELKIKNVNREDIPYYLAKAIIDQQITPEKGAYLIGEISEEFGRRKDLWDFKCLSIQYKEYVDDENPYIENPNYTLEMIKAFKQDVIADIYKTAKEYVEKT